MKRCIFLFFLIVFNLYPKIYSYEINFVSLSENAYKYYLEEIKKLPMMKYEIHNSIICRIFSKYSEEYSVSFMKIKKKKPQLKFHVLKKNIKIERSFFIIENKNCFIIVWDWTVFPDEQFIYYNFIDTNDTQFYRDKLGIFWCKSKVTFPKYYKKK